MNTKSNVFHHLKGKAWLIIFVLLSQMKVKAQLPMVALAFYFNLTAQIFREKTVFGF